MRNLIFFMHTSLDGFVAGPKGEMNWIKVDEEIFDFVATMTNDADMALYGRVTYDMMQSYWPTAAEQPGATKHDIEHASWYKSVKKIVLSRSMNETSLQNTIVLKDDLAEKINAIKNQDGKNILIFGSPSASNALLQLGLIDAFWLFVNPILLGTGMPMFKTFSNAIPLQLAATKKFACGVIALHYTVVR